MIALAFLALTIDVDLSPRLQRGDWRGVAECCRRRRAARPPTAQRSPGMHGRVITTVELGAAPLEYYLPPLHNLARGATVTVSEIDETGYAPLRPPRARRRRPAFACSSRRDVHGLIVYRFVSAIPRAVSEATLRRHVITLAHPEVLVGVDTPLASSHTLSTKKI